MTTTTIVSGFHPEGYQEYGAAFMQTFDRYWPPDVKIVVYTETPVPTPGRIEQRSLWSIPGVKEFIDSHQDPVYHGKKETRGWREKDRRANESYRFDAVKFCKQLFVPDDAAWQLPDGDILAWFDGDVVSYEEVPDDLIGRLLDDHDLVYIGRNPGNHSDLGFWAVKLNANTRNLLRDIADSYRNGYIFSLHEWHSAYLFDHWVEKYRANGLIKTKSLTTGHGHVWFKCDIGKYTDHLKGPIRKKMRHSPERFGGSLK